MRRSFANSVITAKIERVAQMAVRLRIYSGFLVICLLWGSSWAAVKLGLETVPQFLSLGIRFSIASSILGLVIVIQHLRVPTEKIFWKLVVILCSTSFTIPFVLIYWAQIQVNSGLASVLFATFPLWVAIFSHFFLPNEGITPQRIVGMFLGFLGVVVIFNNGFSDVRSTTLLGMCAIILGAIIQAFGLIALRRFGKNMHPVMLTFWPMLMSAVLLLAVSYGTEDYSTVLFDIKTVGSLVYLSIFCTVVTFVIYFWLVKHIEVVILSLSAFITPVIAVFIGVIMMGEEFTSTASLGSTIVLVGVAVATIGDLVAVYRREKSEI
jgi:drug/metabolite transporter (DMT)-like permease